MAPMILDVLVQFVDFLLDLFMSLADEIPVPEFLQNYSLGALFGMLPASIQWFIIMFRLPEAFSLISGAYAFRTVRKLVTFGLW